MTSERSYRHMKQWIKPDAPFGDFHIGFYNRLNYLDIFIGVFF